MVKIKKGDVVQWTSQAGGYTKTKVGKVVKVVGAGVELSYDDATSIRSWGTRPRTMESYLVDVDGTMYWPLTKNLTVVETTVPTPTVAKTAPKVKATATVVENTTLGKNTQVGDRVVLNGKNYRVQKVTVVEI